MSTASKLMAYPSWTARRRAMDQPQPVQFPNYPLFFPQRRVPDEGLKTFVVPLGYGEQGKYGPGADTSANPFEMIIDIVE